MTKLPAQYAKFITSLAGLLVTYLQLYGGTWHLVPAFTAIGAALAVLGVPNATAAAQTKPPQNRPPFQYRPPSQPPVPPMQGSRTE
jgi:hypothetical protein